MRRGLVGLVVVFWSVLGFGQDSIVSIPGKVDTADNGDYSGFDAMAEDLKGYNVYMAGENHLFLEGNHRLELKLFKYLHENYQVNTLMFEFGQAVGELINAYVYEGDSAYIDVVDSYFYPEQSRMIRDLRAYHLELNDSLPFKLVGIDIDRNYNVVFRTLTLLFPEAEVPDSISLEIGTIKSLADFYKPYKVKGATLNRTYNKPYINVNNSVEELLKQYQNKLAHFQAYLGDRFDAFDRIMKGVKKGNQWYQYQEDGMVQSPHLP